jgi:hypothetical protein
MLYRQNKKGEPMPLRVNVGLSRKVGEANYGSRGASVNVEMELDAAMIGEPARLQEQIRKMFATVRTSLAEELIGNGHAPAKATRPEPPRTNGEKPPASSNGQPAQGNGSVRMATTAQVRAIRGISRQVGMDLACLRQQFGVGRPEDLTLKQASALIDELKSAQTGGSAG